MNKSFSPLSALALSLGLSASAQAQLFNELFINPPGTDNGLEFFELSGAASQSLDGLTVLAIEGDGTTPGVIDQAISLSGLSLGSNGLFLWRDSATVLSPSPDAGTAVQTGDFSPDLENGSNTYLLVNGFSGSLAQDLDTNDDGILDLTPWTSVLDAVGITENDGANNRTYLTSVGYSAVNAIAGFNADALIRVATTGPQGKQWVYGDVTGSSPGPFLLSTEALTLPVYQDGSAVTLPSGASLTPGSANFAPVPEPEEYAAMAAGGLVAFAIWRRRQSR